MIISAYSQVNEETLYLHYNSRSKDWYWDNTMEKADSFGSLDDALNTLAFVQEDELLMEDITVLMICLSNTEAEDLCYE